MNLPVSLLPASLLSSVVAAVSLVALSSSAHAEDRVPSQRFEVDSSMADIVEPTGHTSNIIYLNKCSGGCTIYPGYDDSRTNTSSVVAGTLGQTAYISEFAYGQAEWDDIVECVTRVYEPFGVIITDVDPGNVSHFEAIVAGRDDEINTSAGGIAPASCGVINNAITFSFANQGSLSQMCWTVAQETAHAFGLDHEFLCSDPLTYLSDCGFDKTFQDVNAPCGEFQARGCSCGGSTQNSYRYLRDHFGSGMVTPPEVSIKRPSNGQVVKPNFPFEVGAVDDVKVASVEFLINGQVVQQLNSEPWVINAPDGLAGRVTVQARAKDNLGSEASTTSFEVVIDDTLVDFAGDCSANADCESNLCAIDAEGAGSCSEFCDLANDACPSGSSCIEAGTQSVCWVKSGGGSTGLCSAAGPSTMLSGLMMLLAFGWLGRRRRSALRGRANDSSLAAN